MSSNFGREAVLLFASLFFFHDFPLGKGPMDGKLAEEAKGKVAGGAHSLHFPGASPSTAVERASHGRLALTDDSFPVTEDSR